MTPITCTTVAFDDIPQMIENGWDVMLFSEARQKAVMYRREAVKLNAQTGVPYNIKPKLGDKDPKPPGDHVVDQPKDIDPNDPIARLIPLR
jgi:hypothetical protein